MEVNEDLAKENRERMLDLMGAFRREWSTLDPPESLACWGQALEELEVDSWAAERLADLALTDPMGRAEAVRILAHLFKQASILKSPSKYLLKAIDGASQYLHDWRLYEAQTPDLGRGPQGWGRWRDYRGPHDRPEPVPRPSADPAWAGWRPSTSEASSSSAGGPRGVPPAPPATWGQPSSPWEGYRPSGRNAP